MIFKTEEEDSWQFSIPDEILVDYTVLIPPGGNPLSGILQLTASKLLIDDLSSTELEVGTYYIDLLYTHLNGYQSS